MDVRARTNRRIHSARTGAFRMNSKVGHHVRPRVRCQVLYLALLLTQAALTVCPQNTVVMTQAWVPATTEKIWIPFLAPCVALWQVGMGDVLGWGTLANIWGVNQHMGIHSDSEID